MYAIKFFNKALSSALILEVIQTPLVQRNSVPIKSFYAEKSSFQLI